MPFFEPAKKENTHRNDHMKNSNPPGLPAWPSVNTADPEFIIISGRLRDCDIIKKRGLAIAWLFAAFILVVLLAPVALSAEFRFSDPMVALFLAWWVIMIAGFGWFLFPHIVGLPAARLVSILRPQKVELRFETRGVAILHPVCKRRAFDIRTVPSIEFHVSPGPPDKWVDGVAGNLVFGSEVVRLFRIGLHYEQKAKDFVACCRWAAARSWSGRNETADNGAMQESPINDLD